MKKTNYLLLLSCIFTLVSCNKEYADFEEDPDIKKVFLLNDFNRDIRRDTIVFPREPAEPIDPNDPPLIPSGPSDLNFDRYYTGEVYLSQDGSGEINTGFSKLSDEYVYDASNDNDPSERRLIGIEYTCNNGIIFFKVGPFSRKVSLPYEYEIKFKDKEPTIYHHGSSFLLDYMKYTIKVHFIFPD